MALGLLSLLVGCKPDFTSVVEACPESLSGSEFATMGANEAFLRLNCYRRIAGLDEAWVDEGVQAAVTAHLDYMLTHDELGDAEDPDQSGYTGADAWERLDAFGVNTLDVGLWGWVSEDATLLLDPDVLVDLWVEDPYLRQAVMQPSWGGGGFAKDGEIAYWNGLFTLPVLESRNFPIVYPAHGQQDVPTSWVSPYVLIGGWPDDGIPDGDVLGYPITITTGSQWIDTSSANLHGMTVTGATLTGPAGDVPMYLVEPGMDAPISLLFTAVLVPESELAADADYTFEADVAWLDGNRDVVIEFHTTAGSDE